MTTAFDLGETRPSGRREAYLDGLLELAIGGLLFIVALATGRPAFYWTYLIAILILGPGLRRLKAHYTYPRIGYVRFPSDDPRSVRKGVTSWVLGVFVLVAVALTLSGHFADRLAWRRAAPAMAGLMFAGGFLYLARQSHLARHYVLAAASALLGILLVWPTMEGAYGNLRVWAIMMALLSLVVGADVLRRFVRDHPRVEDRMPDVR